MGLLFVAAAVVLLVKLQANDSPVWVYLLAIPLVVAGGLMIAFGYDSFIHG